MAPRKRRPLRLEGPDALKHTAAARWLYQATTDRPASFSRIIKRAYKNGMPPTPHDELYSALWVLHAARYIRITDQNLIALQKK